MDPVELAARNAVILRRWLELAKDCFKPGYSGKAEWNQLVQDSWNAIKETEGLTPKI